MWHFLSQSKPVLESQNPRIIERQSGRICRLVGQGELQPSHLANEASVKLPERGGVMMPIYWWQQWKQLIVLTTRWQALFTMKVKVKGAQSCPTLCDPMDCGPSGSSVYGILQARILEWVAIPFSRGSSQSKDQTQVSRIAGRFLMSGPPGKPVVHIFNMY